MAVSFDKAVAFILRHEGDYSNDPADPGGETHFGISKRAFPDVDIKSLTKGDAIGIYRTHYWLRCQCDLLPPGLAMVLFDGAVNQGAVPAIRMLQQSLGVKADGVMGPVTITAANQTSPRLVLVDFVARRAFQYALVPQVQRYGLGWFRRLQECAFIAVE